MTVQKTQQKLISQDIIDFTKHKEDIRIAAEQAKDIIIREAVAASQAIAGSAELAAKAIASAAEIAVRVVSVKNADDHDLLIELKVGNNFIRDDIKSLTNGLTLQMDELRKSKANKTEFDDLSNEIHGKREDRMRSLENRTANYMITMGLLMVAIGTIVTIFMFHIFKTP